MLRNIIEGASIRGIVAACPTEEFNNLEYADSFGEKYVKKNIRMTGVESYRVCRNEQTASDLCFIAAEKLLADLNWDRDEIGALVFVTQFPDYQAPSTAFVLQHRLGVGTSCVAFDVNLGCSGYVVGLQIVASLLKGSNMTKGLLLCGDTASKNINKSNRSTALLFGDAGSATAIELGDAGWLDCAQMSKGDGYKSICSPKSSYRYFGNNPDWKKELDSDVGYIGLADSVMNGDEVFQFTMTDVTKLFGDYFTETETTPADYDCFVFHQAQKLILDSIGMVCDMPSEKILSSLEHFGNTSVASIPLTLCLHREELQEKEIIRAFMSGFGIGLSYGLAVAEIDPKCIGDIIFSDEYYQEWA